MEVEHWAGRWSPPSQQASHILEATGADLASTEALLYCTESLVLNSTSTRGLLPIGEMTASESGRTTSLSNSVLATLDWRDATTAGVNGD